MYYYHRSKQDLLVAIFDRVMADLIETCRVGLARASDDPRNQLASLIDSHVRFQIERRDEARISILEVRSLEPLNRERFAAQQRQERSLFDGVIRAGADGGVFETEWPADASRAIATMSSYVAMWYRPEGDLSASDIAARYVEMSLSLLNTKRDI
jgi:AcrR family transcriptional regulator